MEKRIRFLGLSELFKDIHPKDLEGMASWFQCGVHSQGRRRLDRADVQGCVGVVMGPLRARPSASVRDLRLQ